MTTKERKKLFKEYLVDLYKPSLLDATTVFDFYKKVNNYCKSHNYKVENLFDIALVKDVEDLRAVMLSQRSKMAYGMPRGQNERLMIIDKYKEFLLLQEQKLHSVDTHSADTIHQDSVLEGMISEAKGLRRGRNRAIRDECAKQSGYRCYVCQMNFVEAYGERGKNFIEVHHTKPMATYDDEHPVKLEDLKALCSNCHSMVHYGGNLLSVDELKEEYDRHKL